MVRPVLVAVVVALLAAAAPAAPARDGGGRYAVRGQVVVSWHGAADRCAAAGVCGVRGTLTVGVAQRGSYSSDDAGSSVNSSGGGEDPVVRVTRDGAHATCVERVGDGFGGVSIRRILGGRGALLLGIGGDLGDGLGAGRCAGPRPADLRPVLPAAKLPLRLVRPVTRDLSGRRTFAAGAFDGEVVNDLRLTLRPAPPRRESRRARRPPPASAVPPRGQGEERRRVAVASVGYRVVGVTGEILATFEAGPEGCELLDACGTTGRVAMQRAPGGSVAVYAEAPLRGRRPRTVADVTTARGAAVRGWGNLGDTAGVVTGETSRPGEPPCRDRIETAAGDVHVERRGSDARFGVEPASRSGLRTRCAGPYVPETPAFGTIALGALGEPRLQVTVRPRGGSFADAPYFGRRDGEMTLELEHVASDVRVERRARLR